VALRDWAALALYPGLAPIESTHPARALEYAAGFDLPVVFMPQDRNCEGARPEGADSRTHGPGGHSRNGRKPWPWPGDLLLVEQTGVQGAFQWPDPAPRDGHCWPTASALVARSAPTWPLYQLLLCDEEPGRLFPACLHVQTALARAADRHCAAFSGA